MLCFAHEMNFASKRGKKLYFRGVGGAESMCFVFCLGCDGVVVGVESDLCLELLDGGVGLLGFFECLFDDIDVFAGSDVDVVAELIDFFEEVGVGLLQDPDGAFALISGDLKGFHISGRGWSGFFLILGIKHIASAHQEPVERNIFAF